MQSAHTFGSLVRKFLPGYLLRRVSLFRYPRLVAAFTEDKWPYSSAVKQFISPGDTVIDIGANIGCITSLFAHWVGSNGSVFAFEPIPSTHQYLERSVRRNNLANVRTYNCGLSSNDGAAVMEMPCDRDGGGMYEAHVSDKLPQKGGIPVELRKLDSVLRDNKSRITFIKIDVEGHEAEVIRGARQTLELHHPALLIESAGDPATPGTKAFELFQLLKDCQYAPYLAIGETPMSWTPGAQATDYLFLPASRK